MSLIVIPYLLVSLMLGLIAARRIQGRVGNYYVAGKSLPLWIAACTLSAQSLDCNATLGNATFAFQDGFWSGAVLPIGLAMALYLTGLFFARPLNALKLLTLPDYFKQRYGRQVEVMVSILTVVSFIILLAGNLAGAGIVCAYFTGIPFFACVALFALVVLVYTVCGGLFSVAWNDIFHISTLFASIPAVFFALTALHGWGMLGEAVARISLEPTYLPAQGALATWAAILALGLGDIVALDFMERVFAAKTPATAARACYLAGTLTLLAGIPVTLMGMMAWNFYPAGQQWAFLKLISEQTPIGLGALIWMGILGASMSTCDGAVLATSAVVTRNILGAGSRLAARAGELRLLRWTRLAALPIVLSAVVLAVLRPDPGRLLILAFDVVFAGCLVPLAAGVYWKKSTPIAAAVSIVLASLARLILYFTVPDEYAGLETLTPPLICLLLFVSISWLTQPRRPHPVEQIQQGDQA